MADITVTAAQVAAVFPDKAEIVDMIANETITAGQAVYRLTTGRAALADANGGAALAQFRGIALTGGGAGQAISVLTRGHVAGFAVSGLNAEAIVYLSNTAGAVADAASVGGISVNCGRVVTLTDAAPTKCWFVETVLHQTWS